MRNKFDIAKRLIKKYEGFKEQAYLCPANVVTIGYGRTGKTVKIGDRTTREAEEMWLDRKLLDISHDIDRLIDRRLNAYQQGALMSWVYNLGTGSLKESTLRRKLNSGYPMLECSDEILRWVKANNRVLPGLVKRRHEEWTIFNTNK